MNHSRLLSVPRTLLGAIPRSLVAKIVGALASAAALLAVVAFVRAGLHDVASHERAVVLHRDASLTTLQPGRFQWITPILNGVTVYDVQDHVFTDTAVGISLDLQETSTEVTVRYRPRIDAIQTIHRTLGAAFQEKVVVPAVQDAVKAAVSYYNVEELTGDVRQRVKQDVIGRITADLADANLEAIKISITDFDFSKEFNHAIEMKAIAQQRSQEERNHLEQVRYQAEQAVVEATSQAEAARLLQSQRAESYLYLKWLEKWDGHLPATLASSSSQGSILMLPPSAR